MKTTALFPIIIALFSYLNLNAQINSYYVSIIDTANIQCRNGLWLNAFVGPLDENGGYAQINWGDGSIEIVPIDWPFSQSLSFEKNVFHEYLSAGNYNVDVQFYSGTNGMIEGTGVQLVFPAIVHDFSSCAYTYGHVYQISPGLNYTDVPLDFIGSDGTTTTITPSANNLYSGLNINNLPYTVNINSAWLNNHDLTQVTSNPGMLISSFDTLGYGFDAANPYGEFEVICNSSSINPDFNVQSVIPFNFIAPLETGELAVSICNITCSDSSNVTVSVTFPSGFLPDITNLINPVINGNLLIFDLMDVLGCETITIPFSFPGTTSVNTEICFTVSVENTLDQDTTNNLTIGCGIVLNSYDPNIKLVDCAWHLDPANKEILNYSIHFQNDGNFEALKVEIIDTISSNLDLSTFQLLNSKHPVSVNIDLTTRIVKFVFNNIDLEPSSTNLQASQGFVDYSIAEIVGLVDGDVIENTAYIYFDFNPAIITNTTYNINTTLGITESKNDFSILYPNPASNSITISNSKANEIVIIDITGKKVYSQFLTDGVIINIEALLDGIYTVVLIGENSTQHYKLIVENK